MATAFKDQGNKAFQAKDFDKAIELFSKGIELDPQNHVLYSNRSAAQAAKKQYAAAVEDAEKVCFPSLVVIDFDFDNDVNQTTSVFR